MAYHTNERLRVQHCFDGMEFKIEAERGVWETFETPGSGWDSAGTMGFCGNGIKK